MYFFARYQNKKMKLYGNDYKSVSRTVILECYQTSTLLEQLQQTPLADQLCLEYGPCYMQAERLTFRKKHISEVTQVDVLELEQTRACIGFGTRSIQQCTTAIVRDSR